MSFGEAFFILLVERGVVDGTFYVRETTPPHACHAHAAVSRPHPYIENEKGKDSMRCKAAAVSLDHHFHPSLQAHVPGRYEVLRSGFQPENRMHLPCRILGVLFGL